MGELILRDAGLRGAVPATANHSERIETLDFFRGVAILMVIAGHFLPERLVFGGAANAVSTLGRGGVIVFFLLSGYLIFKNLQTQKLTPFLCRRFFKIFPAYWLNVLMLVALGQFVGGFEAHSTSTYLANFFMVSDLFKTASISGVYWTLLIEVKFYIFISLYFYFLKSRFISLVFFLMIVANGIVFMLRGQASLLLTFFPVFFVGIQVFLAERSGWEKGELARLFLITAVAGLSVLFYDHIYGAWSLWYVLGGTFVMVWLLKNRVSNKSLAFFGKISYSNYLYHTVVGYFLFALIGVQETWVGNLLVVLTVTGVTTLVAYVSYLVVEVPFVQFWKTHESKWIHGRLR